MANLPPRVVWRYSDNPITCFEGCQIHGFGRQVNHLFGSISHSHLSHTRNRLSSPAPSWLHRDKFSNNESFLGFKTSSQFLISKPINLWRDLHCKPWVYAQAVCIRCRPIPKMVMPKPLARLSNICFLEIPGLRETLEGRSSAPFQNTRPHWASQSNYLMIRCMSPVLG